MEKKNTAPALAKRPSVRGAPHQVRIIGGQWKRTPLTVPDADGLRPTPDRVRETVFNWLTHLLDGEWQDVTCLDLFAGSGALGFEAASRGARKVTLVESHPQAVKQLEAACAKLRADNIAIVRGDAWKVLQNLAQQVAAVPSTAYTLIFLDPPYHQDWIGRILPLCESVLQPGGMVYVELEHSLISEPLPAWMANWEVLRADKAGMVFYHLIGPKNPAEIRA
jgi:16S rRNA (guanine966-N2)-methyltransferase